MLRVPRIVGLGLLLTTWACRSDDVSGPSTDDPAAASLVTSDIANFWRAVDKGGDAASFDAEYLAKGSTGLKDFIRLRNLTGTSLSQMVRQYPRYFASVRDNMLALGSSTAVTSVIRANFVQLKALYPAATFPPVTFLVGRFSTGGTTSGNGMLIGTEFYSLTDASPVDELQPFQRANVRPLTALPWIVAHEHIHIQQAHAQALLAKSGKNLLEQSLLEGTADFLGELVSGGTVNSRQMTFGLAHEAALWSEFQPVMHGADVSRWLYNQGSSTDTPDRPGDLGYFIGYRIARAYYQKATDKTRALAELIEVRDADALLAASGYNGAS